MGIGFKEGDGSVESLDPGHFYARSYSLMEQPTGAGLGQGDGWVDICALASEEIRGRVGPVGASSQERERDDWLKGPGIGRNNWWTW